MISDELSKAFSLLATSGSMDQVVGHQVVGNPEQNQVAG